MTMYASEKSDPTIVPKKLPNKEVKASAEAMEGRVGLKGNSHQTAAVWTQSQVAASPGLMAVRQLAQRDKSLRFTALFHHVSIDLLRQSYRALNRAASPGVDGITWRDYGEELETRLRCLHVRLHAGRYRAKPARRIEIPKPDGRRRPLSIQCLEDKIVQQALVYVLNAIYETDFKGFSYGFRPGRSQHDALDALQVALYRRKVNWVLEVDIREFFDSMSHEWLMRFLAHRIADKRLLRVIRKWLKVGVQEEDKRTRSSKGSAQGSVISPLLANIYLHYVHDLWIESWRNRRAKGDVIVVRYADDVVIGFQSESEGKAFLEDLRQRLNKFGLELHPEKTRLIRFGRYAIEQCKRKGERKPEVFEFLGFTHCCTVSYKTGWFTVSRMTSKRRMRIQLREIKESLRRRKHRSIAETGEWLRRVLQGHLNYYAVPGNGRNLSSLVYQVSRYWLRMLRRRSQRHCMTWERFAAIRDSYLPTVRILHPQPLHRFDAKTQERSPVR
jgi:RNA-directed DNA polymerase